MRAVLRWASMWASGQHELPNTLVKTLTCMSLHSLSHYIMHLHSCIPWLCAFTFLLKISRLVDRIGTLGCKTLLHWI